MNIEHKLVDDTYFVTLDSPRNLNAQSPSMWDQLAEIFDSIPVDAQFVVLRGNGPSFSAGLDRAMFTPSGIPGEPSFLDMADLSASELDAQISRYQRPFRLLRDIPQISVALVHGYAIGAGFQLALACDILITTPDSQMALKEVSLGLIPDLGGAGHIQRIVGYNRALEICASGRYITGKEAVELGIASFSGADLDAELANFLAPIRSNVPQAVTEAKLLLRNIAYGEDPWLAERQSQARRLTDLKRLFRNASADGNK
jgi:enoyl-CoA hydratase/carnithine racemase